MADIKNVVVSFQKNEITEYYIYNYLSKRITGKNKEILKKIAEDELKHYKEWKQYTNIDVNKNNAKYFFYILVSRLFGITFAVKLMENGEKTAETTYKDVEKEFPLAKEILKDEFMHEKMLINMIEEEKLTYLSSMILGLNDALVEITGTLAGLTFALRSSITVGVAGIITGSAASLSMAASEYLSRKAERGNQSPIKASFYTFLAYLTVVFVLVLPFFLFKSYSIAFSVSVVFGILVVLFFSFFVSVVQDRKFISIFLEMFLIAGSVAVISFLIGYVSRKIFHINI